MADNLFQEELPVDEVYNSLFNVSPVQNPFSKRSADSLSSHVSLINNGGDIEKSQSEQSRDNLMLNGKDATIAQAAEVSKESARSGAIKELDRILLEGNTQDIVPLFQDTKDTIDKIKKGPADFEASAKASVLASDMSSIRDPNALSEQEQRLEYYAQRSQKKSSAIKQILEVGEKSKEKLDILKVGEFAQTVVPFFQQTAYAGAVMRSLSDAGFISEKGFQRDVLSGEQKALIAESFKKAAPEQVDAWMEAFMSPFKNEDGEIDVDDINSLAYSDMIAETLEAYNNDPDEFNESRLADNVFSLLDLAFAGEIARGTGKVAISMFSSKSSLASTVKDSRRSSAAIAAAVQDPAVAARLGTTQEEAAVVAAYPKDLFADALSISPDIARYIPAAEEAIDEATKLRAVLQAADRDNAIASKIEEISDAFGMSPSSIVITDSDYYDFTARMSLGARSSKAGFRSYEKALAAMDEYGLSLKAPEVSIVRKNPDGTVEKVTDAANAGKGSFFIQYEKRIPFTAEDASAFGELAPSTIIPNIARESTNIFSPEISRQIAAGYDKESFIATRIGLISESFNQLRPWQRSKVANVAQAGKNEGRYFTRDELINDHGLSSKEADGYASLVMQDRTLFQISNTNLRRELGAVNALLVKNEKKGIDTFGIPVKKEAVEKDFAGQSAYDYDLGHLVKLDAKAIEDIYSKGGKIVALLHRSKTGDDITGDFHNIAIVRGDTTLQPLPVKVLSDRPGYFGMRAYKEAFFIDKVPKEASLNGVSQTGKALDKFKSTQEAARTRQFAIDRAEELALADPTHDYIVRTAREIVDRPSNLQERVEYFMNSGLMRGSKRGEPLKLTDGTLASQLDVVSSLANSRQKVASYATHEQIVASLKKSFMKAYQDDLGAIHFPSEKSSIDSAKAAPEVIDSARAHWTYINMLDKSSETIGRKAWQSSMRALATAAGKLKPSVDAPTGLTRVARAVIDNIEAGLLRQSMSGKDPLGAARAAGFYLMVAGNPLRQALIQTTQHIMLAGLEPAFMATGAPYRASAALTAAYIARGKKIAGRTAGDPLMEGGALGKLAVAGGFKDVKELEQTLDAMMKSGILQSVDKHLLATGSSRLASEVGNPLTYTVKSSLDLIPEVIRRVGFDPWEGSNRVFIWQFSRKRFMDKHPGEDPLSEKAINWIAGDAEILALNMNKGGQSPLLSSNSILQLAFQYIAPAQKAFNLMLPITLGGTRTLTGAEKGRIALIQAALWGTAGIGLKELYEQKLKVLTAEKGIEVPPGFEEYLEGGLAQIATDRLLKAAGGEGGLDITTISPTREAGLLSFIISNAYGRDSERTMIETLFGPSGTLFKRMHDKGQLAYDIMFISPDQYDSNKVQQTVLTLASSFSSVNNYMAASMAAERGYWANSANDPIVTAAWDQILARGLFGFRTKAEADEYLMSRREKDVEEALIDQVRRSFKVIDQLEASLEESGELGGVSSYYSSLNIMIASLEPDMKERFFKIWERETLSRVKRGQKQPGYKALERYMRTGDSAFEQLILNSDMPEEIKSMVREIKDAKEQL